MCVYYRNERWKIINQPVRNSLMLELQDSDGDMRITIQSCSDSRRQKIVSLREVKLGL